MLPTIDVLCYMRAHANDAYIVETAFDDPIMLQAELDGLAVRENNQWRCLGIIQSGERRTVRHCYGEPRVTIVIGTEEIRARCEAELRT